MAFSFGMREFKKGFFDAEKVLSEAAKFREKVMAKFGAYTRRRMQTSIKYSDGVARPGAPPFAHRSKGFTRAKKDKKTGAETRRATSPLRELIFFSKDPAAESVVVGPVLFGRGVARVIERGGQSRQTNPRTGLVETHAHAPHPFAGPAGRAEAQKFPELLRSMVK